MFKYPPMGLGAPAPAPLMLYGMEQLQMETWETSRSLFADRLETGQVQRFKCHSEEQLWLKGKANCYKA